MQQNSSYSRSACCTSNRPIAMMGAAVGAKQYSLCRHIVCTAHREAGHFGKDVGQARHLGGLEAAAGQP